MKLLIASLASLAILSLIALGWPFYAWRKSRQNEQRSIAQTDHTEAGRG